MKTGKKLLLFLRNSKIEMVFDPKVYEREGVFCVSVMWFMEKWLQNCSCVLEKILLKKGFDLYL